MRLDGDSRERLRVAAIVAVIVGGFIAFQQLAPSLDIEGFLEDLAESLGDLTYALVGLLAFLETGAFVGLVFPGETAVILGGALAGQGENSVVLMLAVVWFCAWAGDSVSFLIGIRLGRGFILRHGPKVRITRERFAQVEGYFGRHGGKTILIGRFIGLVRALAPFIAGSSGMRYRMFLPYSVLGTGLWAATFTLLGFFISESINEATELAGRGTFVFGSVVAAVVAIFLTVRFMRQRENRQRLARWMDARPPLRPLVALGRRIEPQVRFVYHRLTPGGLGLEFTSLLAILAVAVFVCVGYAIVVTDHSGPTPGDREAFEIAAELNAAWLVDVAKVVTELGSTPATLAVGLVAGAVLAFRRRWIEVAVLAAALVVAHVGVSVLKDALDRPRPGGELVSSAESDAYPSGHATYAVIYAWVAITVAVRIRPKMTHATALIAAGIVVTAIIGLTRVYLRAHFWSDVAGGWGLGAAAFAACATVAILVAHLMRLRQNRGAA